MRVRKELEELREKYKKETMEELGISENALDIVKEPYKITYNEPNFYPVSNQNNDGYDNFTRPEKKPYKNYIKKEKSEKTKKQKNFSIESSAKEKQKLESIRVEVSEMIKSLRTEAKSSKNDKSLGFSDLIDQKSSLSNYDSIPDAYLSFSKAGKSVIYSKSYLQSPFSYYSLPSNYESSIISF